MKKIKIIIKKVKKKIQKYIISSIYKNRKKLTF